MFPFTRILLNKNKYVNLYWTHKRLHNWFVFKWTPSKMCPLRRSIWLFDMVETIVFPWYWERKIRFSTAEKNHMEIYELYWNLRIRTRNFILRELSTFTRATGEIYVPGYYWLGPHLHSCFPSVVVAHIQTTGTIQHCLGSLNNPQPVPRCPNNNVHII